MVLYCACVCIESLCSGPLFRWYVLIISLWEYSLVMAGCCDCVTSKGMPQLMMHPCLYRVWQRVQVLCQACLYDEHFLTCSTDMPPTCSLQHSSSSIRVIVYQYNSVCLLSSSPPPPPSLVVLRVLCMTCHRCCSSQAPLNVSVSLTWPWDQRMVTISGQKSCQLEM